MGSFASFAPGVPPWKIQSTWLQRQIFECRPLTFRLSTHNIPATAQQIHNQNQTSAKLAHCETILLCPIDHWHVGKRAEAT